MKVTNTIPSVICECGLITLKLICFNMHNSVVLSHAHMRTHVTEFPIQSSMLYVFSWLCLLIGFLLFVFTLVVLSPMCLSSFTLVVPVFRDGVCAFVFFLPFSLNWIVKQIKHCMLEAQGFVCSQFECVFFSRFFSFLPQFKNMHDQTDLRLKSCARCLCVCPVMD